MYITRGRLQCGPFFIGLVPMLETQHDNLRRLTLPVVTAPCLLEFRLAQPCTRKQRRSARPADFVPPLRVHRDRARGGAGGKHSPTCQNGYDRTGGKRITAFNISQSILKNGYERTRFRGLLSWHPSVRRSVSWRTGSAAECWPKGSCPPSAIGCSRSGCRSARCWWR